MSVRKRIVVRDGELVGEHAHELTFQWGRLLQDGSVIVIEESERWGSTEYVVEVNGHRFTEWALLCAEATAWAMEHERRRIPATSISGAQEQDCPECVSHAVLASEGELAGYWVCGNWACQWTEMGWRTNDGVRLLSLPWPKDVVVLVNTPGRMLVQVEVEAPTKPRFSKTRDTFEAAELAAFEELMRFEE